MRYRLWQSNDALMSVLASYHPKMPSRDSVMIAFTTHWDRQG